MGKIYRTGEQDDFSARYDTTAAAICIGCMHQRPAVYGRSHPEPSLRACSTAHSSFETPASSGGLRQSETRGNMAEPGFGDGESAAAVGCVVSWFWAAVQLGDLVNSWPWFKHASSE